MTLFARLSILLCALPILGHSQPTFQRVLGSDGADIAYDAAVLDSVAGISIVAGGMQSSGLENFYLATLDIDGSVIIERDWGTGGNDHLTAVEIATDSTVLVAGEILDSASQAYWNVYLAEIRISDLSTKWERQYAFGQGSGIADMVVDENHIILAGKNNMGGQFDGLLMVLDRSGNWLYGKTIGGSSTDQLTRAAVGDDNLVLAGNTFSSGPGLSSAFLLSLDLQTGGVQWKQARGGTGVDWYMDLHVLSNGDIIAGGYTNSEGQGANDIWLSRFQWDGTLIWERLLGGPTMDFVQTMTVDESRGLIWTSGGEDLLTCCFNLGGSYLWSNHYKLDPAQLTFRDYPYSIQLIAGNSLRIVGKTKSGSMGSTNYYLCQVADNGYTQCNRQNIGLDVSWPSFISDTAIGVASITPVWQNDPVTVDRGLVTTKELECATTTGVDYEEVGEWLSPNPVKSGNLTVRTEGKAQVNIYSSTGQLLLQRELEGPTTLNLDGIRSQIVLVELIEGPTNRKRRVVVP